MGDVSVFSAETREQIREELVEKAKADSQIDAAAHLGSAALGLEDRWSDIDLALGLVPGADFDQVAADWTACLYRDYTAVATVDVRRGDILYRVFLLEDTLQIDLSFWPSHQLRAVGPKFRLIFGVAGDPISAPVSVAHDLIGMAWLYALHVRSSLARSRALEAEHMLSGMRDHVLGLTCARHNVASAQGRGLDDLPQEPKSRARECLARSLEPAELKRAFALTTEILLEELSFVDSGLATRLVAPLRRIVNSLDDN